MPPTQKNVRTFSDTENRQFFAKPLEMHKNKSAIENIPCTNGIVLNNYKSQSNT